jgi:hypothetical protein
MNIGPWLKTETDWFTAIETHSDAEIAQYLFDNGHEIGFNSLGESFALFAIERPSVLCAVRTPMRTEITILDNRFVRQFCDDFWKRTSPIVLHEQPRTRLDILEDIAKQAEVIGNLYADDDTSVWNRLADLLAELEKAK